MRYANSLIVLVMLVPSALAADKPKTIKPLLSWTGIDSKVEKERFLLIQSDKEWREVWSAHVGKKGEWRTYPVVDFDACQVIAIFHGRSAQKRRIDIESLSVEGEYLNVRYWVPGYQVGDLLDHTTHCFLFIIVPKSDKVVVIEENANRRYQPAEWEERARLAPKEGK